MRKAKNCTFHKCPVSQVERKKGVLHTSRLIFSQRFPKALRMRKLISGGYHKDNYSVLVVLFPTVEKRGFKKMIKTLDPRFEVPGRKHFSQTEMPKV